MRRLLDHLRPHFNATKGTAGCTDMAGLAGLDVNGIHVVVAVLGVKLDLVAVGLRGHAGGGHAADRHGGIARVAVVAVGGQELGEEAADDGAEEGQARADDGDVAFCGGPVGGADVAP